MTRITGLLIALLTLMTTAAALPAANLRGTVTDTGGEPMMQATIRLLAAKDSAFVKGGVTDVSGNYSLQGIKKGKYIVEATYIGYERAFANVTVGDGATVNVPKIVMTESSIMLKGVTVTGTKTAIKVSEDTIEYNADSYKTAPNAVVEDLLKRLPGVEVGSDGSITANGKSVSKILVDGKEFFSDDPTVASKNLPVDMVEKLQVVDRKSDLARLTGVDDGEDETVINLTVKKGMKNGWFGNVEAGYGTDDRYKANFNINRFWNENQITFLGNANNINELGFNDGNSGRFRRFGGDNGITTSQALGVNFNVGNGEIFRIGGDIMWNRSNRNTIQQQERQYIHDSLYSTIGKHTVDRSQNVRADLRIQWKPDSFNTLDIRPNISWNHNHSGSLDSTLNAFSDAARTMISRSRNEDDSRGNSLSYGARLIYTHNFKEHRGRSFSVMANYSHTNTHEWEDTRSRNIFYQYNDSTDNYDQFTSNHTWNNNASGRLSWTEPLGDVSRGNFLTVAYSINARWNNADKLVYQAEADAISRFADAATPTGLSVADMWMLNADPLEAMALSETALALQNEPDSTLSNRFRNDFLSQDIRLGYKHVSKTTTLDLGFSVVPTMSRSRNLINDAKTIPERWVWNYAPFVRYRYRMGKQRSIQVNYNGRSSQPSMTQLQPVADMSDPLRIIIGNPNLDPTFNHSLRIRFQDFNAESQRSIMLMGDFGLTQNAIVSMTTFDNTTGGQTTTYRNVNGVWNGRIMNMVSMPFRDKRWQFSNNLFVMYNRQIGFNNGLRNASQSVNFNESPSLAFRPDNLEFELRPRYSLQYTANTLNTTGNNLVHSYGASFHAYYYTPIGLVIDTDVEFSGTSGYAAGYDRNQWMWNASLSYQFLHDKSATLSLKVYDLLQQRSNISRNVTANYIDDTRYNSLTRYFMLSFSWRFNTFGKGKEPSRDNGMMREGPPGGPGGGHPGGGRRPGGRPF
ncbi:MAG: outer membrane beta-barrel protein [Clostridium sp.]|nr:outer membrane beta-barrel protein [Clostridium sp.]